MNNNNSLLIVAFVSLLIGFVLGKSLKKLPKNYDNSSSSINPNDFDEFKLVLLIRNDLGMTKGKVAAQCSHATLACYQSLQKSNPQLLEAWETSGQPKITLKVKDYDEMLSLANKAKEFGLCAKIIRDAGHTQVASGSSTVLGIGPGHLKLY
ncbi:14189_t:CDS:2 [Funneliformis caledonium]|uniref:peptidyl-tRNA hydrolase n=2 Tax=Funneliformis TaxID=1117308 RepID=A0A9N9AIY0_9GLOM|nr:10556_t:CDS:2 [Funneliformis mosseae]CAG8532000.1 14189_t:CDS:2 [Funneliformis caledonium]